jgi:hypothetical protein
MLKQLGVGFKNLEMVILWGKISGLQHNFQIFKSSNFQIFSLNCPLKLFNYEAKF